MPHGDQLPRRQRVARLSLLAAALSALTLLLLGVAAWIVWGEDPGDIIGRLPLNADDDFPAVTLLLAAGAGVVSAFVGLAALHAAAKAIHQSLGI